MATVGSSIVSTGSVIDERVGAPTIANVAMATAATEYDYALPAGTKRFLIKNRMNGVVQLSYSLGTSGTTYETIPRGVFYMEENINPGVAVTLYLQSPSASQIIEVTSWA